MNKGQSLILQWARRVRDFLVEHYIKSDIGELPKLTKELDDIVAQLTAGAAAQEAITKQSRVQTKEIKRLKAALRDTLKPIVRMSGMMTLEINGTGITFVLPPREIDSERLASASDAMVEALNVVGPQFVARGLKTDFVEKLSSATAALRDAIDERSAQLSRRSGTTAGVERDKGRAVKLVRTIDSLVRPAIANDPGLRAAWGNIVALQLPRRSRASVVAAPPASSAPAMLPQSSGESPQSLQVVA